MDEIAKGDRRPDKAAPSIRPAKGSASPAPPPCQGRLHDRDLRPPAGRLGAGLSHSLILDISCRIGTRGLIRDAAFDLSVLDHHPGRGRTLAQLYDQVIGECEHADRLGYDSFLIAEHHFHEYGGVPNPAVLLPLMAARTERIRLGPAICVLPFRNPIEVAESPRAMPWWTCSPAVG
jgi:Luciferase-like monooxygenase